MLYGLQYKQKYMHLYGIPLCTVPACKTNPPRALYTYVSTHALIRINTGHGTILSPVGKTLMYDVMPSGCRQQAMILDLVYVHHGIWYHIPRVAQDVHVHMYSPRAFSNLADFYGLPTVNLQHQLALCFKNAGRACQLPAVHQDYPVRTCWLRHSGSWAI